MKRYEILQLPGAWSANECENGQWCKVDDVAKLEAKYTNLIADLEEITGYLPENSKNSYWAYGLQQSLKQAIAKAKSEVMP